VSAAVDIIVPVYRGELETRACLESVLAASANTPREVVVVDDASPEPTISAWLRELASRGVHFRDEPHLVAKLPDREIWMAFFDDGEGNVMAITSEL